jgi:hypothetical protein
LNIEGIAVFGGKLLAGLRAPTRGEEGFIVSVPVEALFADGHEPLAAASQTIPVTLGRDAGIRDLATFPGDRLLVWAVRPWNRNPSLSPFR